jgi:CTP synthase (UTP-ammonia lyase)
VITPLACSLVGQAHSVAIRPGTLAARLYGTGEAVEDYFCNYGVNVEYQPRLEAAGLVISGVGGAGEVRIVELPGHRFFLATLFIPQSRSTPDRPHPILAGFAAAANAARIARSGSGVASVAAGSAGS